MSDYEVIEEDVKDFGNRSYIQVARKRVTDGGHFESEFTVITRGFYDEDGDRRWTKFVTLPDDPEVHEFVAEKVAEVGERASIGDLQEKVQGLLHSIEPAIDEDEAVILDEVYDVLDSLDEDPRGDSDE